jgi:hypothetical protein
MDEVPIVGRESEAWKHVLSQYGGPAYMRRARQVQDAFDQLVARCRQKREEMLAMTRVRLAMLHALAGTWERLLPWLADDGQLDLLQNLHADLAPKLRQMLAATSSSRQLRHALQEFRESVEHFNRRWRTFLDGQDLTEINTLRDGYNRYYVLEKECAVRSPRIARQGFVRLQPLTIDDLLAVLPALPVPKMQDG